MKRSRCILITSTFPVRGETFLRYEIEQLAETFDDVDIISIANGKQVAAESVDQQLLQRFSNVHYKGDIARFTSRIVMPDSALLAETLRELPKSLRGTKSLLKHVYRLFLATKIMRYLKGHYPDDGSCVFYAYWLNAGAIALSSLDHRNNLRVCRAHGSDIYDENIKSGFNSFHHFCAIHLDRVFCISEHGRSYLTEKTGNATAFEVARLGVSLPQVPQDRQGLAKDAPIEMVSCSVVDANKRIGLIVEALQSLGGQRINWTHIGGGPLFEQIKGSCSSLPPGITATFTGSVDNAEIHRLYSTRLFDMFVNTSKSEGIPVAVMEAMSYAIPCLATDVGGTKELVVPSAGRIIPADISGASLGAEIQRFADDLRHVGGTMSAASRLKIESDYCAQDNFHAFAKCLMSLNSGERLSK